MVPKLRHAALAALVLAALAPSAGAQNVARINDQFRGHLSAERYDDAVETAREHPDARTRTGMLLAVAKAQHADDLSYSADTTFEEARNAALTIEDANDRVLILTMAAWLYERSLAGRETPTDTSWPDETWTTLRAAQDVLDETDRATLLSKIESMPSWSEQISARAGIATVDYAAGEEDSARAMVHACIEDALTVSSGSRVRLVAWLSWLLACMNDADGARAGLAHASGFAAEVDDEKKRATALTMVGDLQIVCGDVDGARVSFGPVIALHHAMLGRNTERRPFESMAVARIHSKLGDDAKVLEALGLFHELWQEATGGQAKGALASLGWEELELRVHHGDAATVIAFVEKWTPGADDRKEQFEDYVRKTLGLRKEYHPLGHWQRDDDRWSPGSGYFSDTWERVPTAASFRSALALVEAMPKLASPFDPNAPEVPDFLSGGEDKRRGEVERHDTLCSEIVDAALDADAYDVAEQAAAKLIHPSSMGRVLCRIGRHLHASGNEARARAALDRAIACHTCPDFPQYDAVRNLIEVADVYVDRDDTVRADAVIEVIDAEIRAMDSVGSAESSLKRLAALQRRRGDSIGALATVRRFSRTVAKVPDAASRLIDFGNELDDAGQDKAATLCFEDAVGFASHEDRDPALGTLELVKIADWYEAQGDDERAIELLVVAKDRACTIASMTKRDEMIAMLVLEVMWFGDPDRVIEVLESSSVYDPEERDQALMGIAFLLVQGGSIKFAFDATKVDLIYGIADGIEDPGVRAYAYLAGVTAHHHTGDLNEMAAAVDRMRAIPPGPTFDPDASVSVGAGYVNLALAHVDKESFEEATAASIAAFEVLSSEISGESDADLSYRATMLLQLCLIEAEHGTPERLRAAHDRAFTVVEWMFDDEARLAARTMLIDQMPAVDD